MAFSFAIKYKDLLLDLEENSHLTVDWNSTLFNDAELFKGSYAYAVKLKLSEKNKALLGLPHLLENRLSRNKRDVTILLFGQTWKRASLELNIETDYIMGNLLVDHAIVADWLKETSLPNLFSFFNGINKEYFAISIGNDYDTKARYLSDTAFQSEISFPMAFPCFRNFGWNGDYVNDFTSDINKVFTFPFNYDLRNKDSMFCPMFYLHWLIKEICDKMGFKAVGSFMDDKEFATWILLNNSYYTAREILAEEFFIYPSRHLPDITIGNFFKILRNDLMLGIYFDSLSRKAYFELPQKLIDSSEIINLGNMLVKDRLKIKNGSIKRFTVSKSSGDDDTIPKAFNSIDSFIIGEAETSNKRELSISSTLMSVGYKDRFDVWHYRMPIVEQLANVYDIELLESNAFNKSGEVSKNPFGFKVLSFRGGKPFSDVPISGLIPYATSDNRNAKDQVEVAWMATDPFHEKGWLKMICEKMFQLLIYSDELEFDILCPIQYFMSIHPLAKSLIRTKNGTKRTILFDKITFEPNKRNRLIYARINALGIQNSYMLANTPLNFSVNSQTKADPVTYVFASFIHARNVNENGGVISYGKIYLEFFSDKYRINRKVVDGLTVLIEVHAKLRVFEESQWSKGDVAETVLEKTIHVGIGVSDHIETEEIVYKSTVPILKIETELVLIENPNSPYFFI